MEKNSLASRDIQSEKIQLLSTQVEREQSSGIKMVCEALQEGASNRVDSLKKNPLPLALEISGAATGGAALSLMCKAGGKWGEAAKVFGGFMYGYMTGDFAHRGKSIYDTFQASADGTAANHVARKESIAKNLGEVLVDYPLMFLAGESAAVGVRKLSFGSSRASTSCEPLNNSRCDSLSDSPSSSGASRAWENYQHKYGSADEWRPGSGDWRPGQGRQMQSLPEPIANRRDAAVDGILNKLASPREYQLSVQADILLGTKQPVSHRLISEKSLISEQINEPIALARRLVQYRDSLDCALKQSRETIAGDSPFTLRFTKQLKNGAGQKISYEQFEIPVNDIGHAEKILAGAEFQANR